VPAIVTKQVVNSYSPDGLVQAKRYSSQELLLASGEWVSIKCDLVTGHVLGELTDTLRPMGEHFYSQREMTNMFVV